MERLGEPSALDSVGERHKCFITPDKMEPLHKAGEERRLASIEGTWRPGGQTIVHRS